MGLSSNRMTNNPVSGYTRFNHFDKPLWGEQCQRLNLKAKRMYIEMHIYAPFNSISATLVSVCHLIPLKVQIVHEQANSK